MIVVKFKYKDTSQIIRTACSSIVLTLLLGSPSFSNYMELLCFFHFTVLSVPISDTYKEMYQYG